MQRGLHLLEGEPECPGVEHAAADVNKQQSTLCGVSAQELDFPRAEWAFTVKVQRQRPILFAIHFRSLV